MGRSRQTVRKSTGGKAPRRHLFVKSSAYKTSLGQTESTGDEISSTGRGSELTGGESPPQLMATAPKSPDVPRTLRARPAKESPALSLAQTKKTSLNLKKRDKPKDTTEEDNALKKQKKKQKIEDSVPECPEGVPPIESKVITLDLDED